MESAEAPVEQKEVPNNFSLWQWLLLFKELLPFSLIPFAVCVYSAYVFAPIHWRFVAHHGPNFLWVQAVLLLASFALWTRVPPMPGLIQGVVCIGGWLWLVGTFLGWIPFALGVLAGFNGL